MDDCDFYHTVDIPGDGERRGDWDLRGREAAYLGDVALKDRTVLEVGPASGHLSFWMEKQGAHVTVLDLGPDDPWDFVPFHGNDLDELNANTRKHLQRLQNSWWLLHERHQSKARALRGTVYGLTPQTGQFDVVTLNSVLLHLRDPMRAMVCAASTCAKTLVVTDIHEEMYSAGVGGVPFEVRLAWRVSNFLRRRSQADAGSVLAAHFIPRAKAPDRYDAWFHLPSALVVEMMTILGFRVTLTEHTQPYKGRPYRLFTAVGERA